MASSGHRRKPKNNDQTSGNQVVDNKELEFLAEIANFRPGIGNIQKRSLEHLITQKIEEIIREYGGHAKGLRVKLKRLLLTKDGAI